MPSGLAADPITPAEVEALTDGIVDPPNRYVRYPLSRLLFRVAGFLPFTPNQVTYFHAALGIVTSLMVAFADERWFPLAFLLFEIRAVLDCYDGVLARGKKLFSPWGRTIDELCDAVAFLSLNLAIAYRLRSPMAYVLTFLVIHQGAIAGWSYDFFKRKFTLALRESKDAIASELIPKLAHKRRGGMTFLPAFSLIFDMLQVTFLSRHSREETLRAAESGAEALLLTTDVKRVRAAAKTKKFKLTILVLSLMTGDNTILLLSLGLLFKQLFLFQIIAASYGYVALSTGFLLASSVLRSPSPLERANAKKAEA